MSCSKLRKAACEESKNCEWVVGKGCRTRAAVVPSASPTKKATVATPPMVPKAKGARVLPASLRKALEEIKAKKAAEEAEAAAARPEEVFRRGIRAWLAKRAKRTAREVWHLKIAVGKGGYVDDWVERYELDHVFAKGNLVAALLKYDEYMGEVDEKDTLLDLLVATMEGQIRKGKVHVGKDMDDMGDYFIENMVKKFEPFKMTMVQLEYGVKML